MKYEALKKLKLPDQPGVYFFLKGREIIYIGKATSLKTRTQSYFRDDLIKTRGPITVEMVWKADNVKWEATPSVLEALILEANLIKKHQPYYNIKEKDNKSFNYVVFTREKMPKVLLVRERLLPNFTVPTTNIFGPYTSGTQLREALKILRQIFPFIDSSSSKKQNYEFYKQLRLTPEVDAPNEAYLKNLHYLKLFFKGRKKDIIRSIKKEMMTAARMREFELAGEFKRQLFSLQHINDIALLKLEPNLHSSVAPTFRIEAYDIAHMGGKNMTGVMVVVEESEANKNEYRKFKIRTQADANDTGALTEVLERRLKHEEWRFPDLIVVDGSTAQINAARKALVKAGKLIPVVSVVKDERHKPKALMGDESFARKYKKEILLANSEAHRFAIAYHKNMRNKNFLKIK
jgi:excinuclease UvrABC nuclease subunit